jgi:hypothetical protein
MAYSDFTLKEVMSRFQLHMEEKPDMFSEVPEGEVSALLQSLLQVYVPYEWPFILKRPALNS